MQLLFQERFDDSSTGGGFGIVASVDASTLHSKRFVHHRTSTRDVLQVGDGATAWGLADGG